MIRHIAMFRFLPGTTDDQVRQLADGLRRLPGLIPEISAYRVGPDVALRDGNWDFAVVADFDGADEWRVYATHPSHLEAIAQWVTPIVSERASIQYEW